MTRALSLLAVLIALPVAAQEAPQSEAALVAIATDAERPLPERQTALSDAMRRALIAGHRQGPLRDALPDLLRSLGPHAGSLEHLRLNVAALRALKPYAPLADVAPLLLPFLQPKAQPKLRLQALLAVHDHGARGIKRLLLAMLEEDHPRHVKQRLQLTIIQATTRIPDGERGAVLAKILEITRFRPVKLRTARELAHVPTKVAFRALAKVADANNRDENLASLAALSMLRHGSLAGLGQLIERLQKREGRSRILYRAICLGAHKDVAGFLGTPPARYFDIPQEQRLKVLEVVVAWWEAHKTKSTQDLLFESLRVKLKSKGVFVPPDRKSKEAVTALIAALAVDPSSFRYAALDMLVVLTGRKDLAYDFRSIMQETGKVAIREWEPSYGFEDERRRALLKKQQLEKAEVWRRWWAKAKASAEWLNDRWQTKS